MERTETGWGRTAEPTPRWRSLLDRALLGRGGPEEDDYDGRFSEERRAAARVARGVASYPTNEDRRDGEYARGAYREYPVPPPARDDYPPPARDDYGDYPRREDYPPARDSYREPDGYQREHNGYQRERDADGYQREPDGYQRDSDGYQRDADGYQRERDTYQREPDGYQREPDGYQREHDTHQRESEDYPVTAGRPNNGYPSAGYPTVMQWQQAPAPAPPPVMVAQASAKVTAPAPADPTEHFMEVLRQELDGPHVLAFANPKGGVHKTTATVLAAATIGSVRGQGVIAWDDNELRGTLGLRAGSARHARTIRHLVRDLVDVERSGGYELHERLDDYLRHASDGTYDVLAGEENPRFAQRLDPYTVKRVLELLRRTHDVICVDTGNNVESPNWQTVLQAADQLVVTTVPREDAAFTADWMLDLLDEAGMDDMVANAVTLLSCPTPNANPLIEDLAAHFAGRTRAVVVVPYDPVLESGSQIEYSDLAPATRRAWLRAAGVMMDPYAR